MSKPSVIEFGDFRLDPVERPGRLLEKQALLDFAELLERVGLTRYWRAKGRAR